MRNPGRSAAPLAAYGPDYLEMGRQAGRLADKIIKGENPASLPFERASKFDLTINYRTASFIGLNLPSDAEESRQSYSLMATLEPLAETIRGIPIFSALSREDVAKVLGKLEEISFWRRRRRFFAGRPRRCLLS